MATLCALTLALTSCDKDKGTAESQAKDPTAAPVTLTLPELVLKNDTPDLLLTWIDSSGDFHVVQKPEEVPEEGKKQVRVVVTTRKEGTGRTVYIADLTNKTNDGKYAITTMPRSRWNEIGAARRKVRLDAVLPPASAKASPSGAPSPEALAKLHVTIYGASWCKPCHDAEKFLKKLGVQVTKKDIEKSRAAQAEMQQKLVKAGRGGASIPVIDVGGRLLVGYSPAALKQAVAAATQTTL